MVKAAAKPQKSESQVSYYEDRLKEARRKAEDFAKLIPQTKAEEMPLEICREGRIRHIVNDKMGKKTTSFDAYIQELLPGGVSGKHRHMRDEYIYILEGKGYDMHQDPDIHLREAYEWDISKEKKKFEWEEGDLVYVPVMVAHQHFNADPKKPARFIVVNPRYPIHMNCDLWEQLEDAPEK